MTDPHALACAELAGAVIRQAMHDGCRPHPGARQTGGAATIHERSQAWAFLTAHTGAWAESRASWCWVCGVDPEVIREEALRRGPARGAA